MSVMCIMVYQVGSAILTFALEYHQAEAAIAQAFYQLIGIRGIITMHKEVHDNENS